jgi:hypothetical protein
MKFTAIRIEKTADFNGVAKELVILSDDMANLNNKWFNKGTVAVGDKLELIPGTFEGKPYLKFITKLDDQTVTQLKAGVKGLNELKASLFA